MCDIGPFLKHKLVSVNVLFIPNHIFLFYRQNTIGHTGLTYCRNSPSSRVLEIKVKSFPCMPNHVTCVGIRKEETWVGEAFKLYFVGLMTHVKTSQTNSPKNVKMLL